MADVATCPEGTASCSSSATPGDGQAANPGGAEKAEVEVGMEAAADGGADGPRSDSEDAAGAEGDGEEEGTLSARQLKKMKRREKLVAQRAQWKEREREKRRKKRKEAGGGVTGGGWRWKNFPGASEQAGGAEGEGGEAASSILPPAKPDLTPEEHAARREAAREARKLLKAAELEDFQKRSAEGPTVIIDLEWEADMSEKELKSLVHQVMYCYGHNRSAPKPVNLVLSGLAEGTQTYQKLSKMSGFDTWPLQKLSGPYIDHFPKEKLVYLTADAEEVLETFDPSKAYIIGGIVDHNRLKGVTFAKAEEEGIAMAQLPIDGNVDMGVNSKVLTVNKVLQIVVDFQASGNWKEVLQKGVPSRRQAECGGQAKRKRGASDAEAGDDAGGDGHDGDAEVADGNPELTNAA
eukprot:CAMPEP_0206424584 /NCGR_PEP_ID=MMETSP0324_2-20121206/3313_1 /ASSEMBLY_ACC=CAM_ASM_000836 /TAXON_ID=2866 /ORGANISM="Crypthecodinium cohnii, Strain Seligo" /LENGTH=406 /DNA_ID=CAMNT_0053889263 /DNA_START=85 /DNA_END=1303 /DNA_ORIENTATION=+